MTTTELPADIHPTDTSRTAAEHTTAEHTAAQRTAADAVPTPVGTASRAASSVQAVDASFADFDIRRETVAALAEHGIVNPFPIQAMTLPVALARHDIIGQAKTGTGKTLGFGIPLLEHVVAPGEPGYDELPAPGKPQALVVLPTRELAVQVAGDLAMAAAGRRVRIVQVYGGRAYEPQVEALGRGAEVVVGTPGRMVDLLTQRSLVLTHARTVVLDEADEMLDLGFLPDVEKLLAATPASRHTMLFSATMPGAVVAMARRYMTQPTHIRATDPGDAHQTVQSITQVVYRAHALDKTELLARILQARGRGLTLVFARTKRTAAKVAEDLVARGFAAGAIHGDLGQGAREQALRAFRHGKVDVLVATDVAARGIDVEDVTHVINYQCPEDEKMYLHRTGRTGRAGAAGTAVTFVDWDDVPRWGLINKALDLGIPEPIETYSSSAHIHTDLDIPEGVTGRLPMSQRTRAGLAAEEIEDLGETGKRAPGGHGGGRGHDDGKGRRREGKGGKGDRNGKDRDGKGGRGDRAAKDRDGRNGDGKNRDASGRRESLPDEDEARAARRGAGSGAGESSDGPRRRRRRRRHGADSSADVTPSSAAPEPSPTSSAPSLGLSAASPEPTSAG